MPLFNDKVRTQLGDILKQMRDPVNLVYFTQELECRSCADTRLFLEEIVTLSDRVKLSTYDFVSDADRARSLGIDMIPAIALLNVAERDTGIRFYGIPAGYEINSFLRSLIEASGVREQLPDDIMKRIIALGKDIHIQVFVSLTCPYCPTAVSMAHRLALENPRIRADMVEIESFPHLAQRYSVSGVPRTVVNGVHFLDGAQPVTKLVELLEKV